MSPISDTATAIGTNFPSWLQAFAAIVALGIAVWSTLRSDRQTRRQNNLRARCIATAIYPDILSLRVQVGRSSTTLIELISRSKSHAGQHAMADVMQISLDVPSMLMRNVDNLYLLGDRAGPSCLQLVSVALQYNALVTLASNHLADKAKGEWTDAIRGLEGHLSAISTLVEEAEREIAPLHDGKKL